jgi:hypothetical protein
VLHLEEKTWMKEGAKRGTAATDSFKWGHGGEEIGGVLNGAVLRRVNEGGMAPTSRRRW